jgi:hypothetical protein
MGIRRYTLYNQYATVRQMRMVAIFFYAFSAGVLSLFVYAQQAVAQSRVSGFVFASDSCQLLPPTPQEACLTSLMPISGELELRRRGSRIRYRIELKKNGTFTKKISPGRYLVRLVGARSGAMNLSRSDLRISPPAITVSDASAKMHMSLHLLVSHKARASAPFLGVSDGCSAKS